MTIRSAHSRTRIMGLFARLGAYAPDAVAGHGAPAAGPMLRGNARSLKRILVKLLSDAIRFLEPGNKVEISRGNSGRVLQATDSGIAIAPKDILKALSQFGQIDSNPGPRHDGTGFGLPLTSSLVALLGGSLDLQREANAGTTVTVRFPAARIVESAHDKRSFDMNGRAAS